MKQPAILLALGFIGGIAAGSWVPLWGSLITAAVGSGVATRYVGRGSVVMVIGFALGVARITLAPLVSPPHDLTSLHGQTVAVSGEVISYPTLSGDRQKVTARLQANGQTGQVVVTTGPHPALAPGDQIAFQGSLEPPPRLSDFDYAAYLAKDGIYTVARPRSVTVTESSDTFTRQLYRVHQHFVHRLEAVFPEPAGSFLLGILLGERAGLPENLIDAFQRTGLTHILALSGFNISIILAVVIGVLGRYRLSIFAAIIGLAGFVLLVGPTASVLRAALMGAFLLLGTTLGRPQTAIYAAFVTAAAMLAFKPWSLRYDLGFDLSFLATLGILYYEPAIRQRLTSVPQRLRGLVAATLAAGIFTLPLIVLSFGQVSLVAPVANVLVVPLVPWLMLGGFLTTMAAVLSETIVQPLAMATTLITHLMLNLVDWMADWPLAAIQLTAWRLPLALLVVVGTGLGLRRYFPRHA